MVNPRVVHYATLILGFLVIMSLGSGQWFFGDDWAILAPRFDDDVMLPHVGHWNLVPAVVFPAVRNWFGLDTYAPFLALALLMHLLVAHLSWRILARVGVAPWIATILAALIVFLGGGAENILWAFQFGFMGGIALALGAVLLADAAPLTWPRATGIVALTVVAVAFSGSALPVVAAGALLAWLRHGFLRAVLLFLPAAAGYLAWYLLVARQYPVSGTGIHSISELGGAVLYAGAMFAGGLGRMLPLIHLGVILAAAVAAWFVVTARRGFRGVAAPAYALVIGCLVFAGLTAWARSSLSFTAAASQRYAYLVIVLLLPALGLLVTALAARGTRWSVGTTVGLLALVGFNAALLAVEAAAQSARESESREVVLDSFEAVLDDPGDATLLDAPADPRWAPDLLGGDLLTLSRWGQFQPDGAR